MKPHNVVISFVLLSLVWVLLPTPGHAYLDPGTGSYVLQLLLAAIVGALFAVRLFWGRIRSFFRRLLSKEGPVEEDE